MVRIGVLLSALLLVAAGAGGAGAGASGDAPVALDIQFAFDSTGSMGPTIAQAQKDAERIIDAVRDLNPDARFAVVAFRDPGYPAPEYEVLQRFTGDVNAARAAIGRLRSVTTSEPGNVSSEAYNLVFQRSVDASLGWRPSSRKIVVVLGDAEPHGAGAVGIRGCRDTAPDTHGLKTTDVLQQMHAAGRTLVMVRQPGQAEAALGCYAGMASLAAPGGAARDSGSADLVTPVVSLIEGSLTPLVVQAGLPFTLTGKTITVRLGLANKSGAPATLDALTLRLPAGTSFVSATGALGPPTVGAGLVRWAQPRTLAPGAVVSVAVRSTTGSKAKRLSFVGSAISTLAGSGTISVSASARVRVGRVLAVRLVATAPRSPIKGALSLEYSPSARTLIGRTAVRGTVSLGRNMASSVAVHVTSAKVVAAAASSGVMLTGTVARSANATCRPGTAVTLRLVDRDFRTPRTAADVIELRGKGCGARYTGEVSTG